MSIKTKLAAASFAVGSFFGASAFATGVTLPDSGVDVAEYATAAISSLGAVVAVCVGGVVCFMIVKWGIRWVRGIGR